MNTINRDKVVFAALSLILSAGTALAETNALENIQTGIDDLTSILQKIAASIVALFAVFHGIEFLRSENPDAKEHALKTLAKYAAAAIFIYAGKDLFEAFARLFTKFTGGS